jgi:hypothetical protein
MAFAKTRLNTTEVLMTRARSEGNSPIPNLARTLVSPAKAIEINAYNTHVSMPAKLVDLGSPDEFRFIKNIYLSPP